MPTPRKPNGRILTVKQLSERAYGVIHNIPRGYRGPAMHLLLEGLADFAAKNRKWYTNVRSNDRRIEISFKQPRRHKA